MRGILVDLTCTLAVLSCIVNVVCSTTPCLVVDTTGCTGSGNQNFLRSEAARDPKHNRQSRRRAMAKKTAKKKSKKKSKKSKKR